MIIKSIHIGGFGCLKNLSMEFSPEANLITGDNEAGKSTLLEFIISMLFGYRERERDLAPWDGGEFGGKLCLSSGGLEYEFSRDFSSGFLRLASRAPGEEERVIISDVVKPLGRSEVNELYTAEIEKITGSRSWEMFMNTLLVTQKNMIFNFSLKEKDPNNKGSKEILEKLSGRDRVYNVLEEMKKEYRELTRDRLSDDEGKVTKSRKLELLKEGLQTLYTEREEAQAAADRLAALSGEITAVRKELGEVSGAAVSAAGLAELMSKYSSLKARSAELRERIAEKDGLLKKLDAGSARIDAIREASGEDEAGFINFPEDFPGKLLLAGEKHRKRESLKSESERLRSLLSAAKKLFFRLLPLPAALFAAIPIRPEAVYPAILSLTVILALYLSKYFETKKTLKRIEAGLDEVAGELEDAVFSLRENGYTFIPQLAERDLQVYYRTKNNASGLKAELDFCGGFDKAGLLSEKEKLNEELFFSLREMKELGAKAGGVSALEDPSLALKLNSDLPVLAGKKAVLENRLKSLEREEVRLGGSLKEPGAIEDAIAQLEEEIKAVSARKEALGLAFRLLTDCMTSHEEGYFKTCNGSLSSLFTGITGGRYSGAAIEKKGNEIILKAVSGNREVREIQMSGGTAEQMYFSLRLALYAGIYPGDEPVPLFLDEPFASFDGERLTRSAGLIEGFKGRLQLFILTHNQAITDYFKAGKIHNLNGGGK